jgi:endoglucanase
MRSLEETRPLTVFGAIIPGEETGRVQPWPQHVPKQPDVVIVVDAIHATDVHGVQASSVGEVLLGKGPTLLRASDDSVCNAVEDVANRNNLPVQVVDYGKPYRPPLHMPFAHSHTPAVVSLGFPVRYMHTSVEIIDVRDVRNLHALLTAFCQDLADT